MIFAIEVLTWAFILLIIFTQVLIPSLNGVQLWPLFRRTAKLEKEMSAANQEAYDAILEKTVKNIRRGKNQ